MPSESQRKFPKELQPWLRDLPSNYDFGSLAQTYNMTKTSLLNLRVRLKAKAAKKSNILNEVEK